MSPSVVAPIGQRIEFAGPETHRDGRRSRPLPRGTTEAARLRSQPSYATSLAK